MARHMLANSRRGLLFNLASRSYRLHSFPPSSISFLSHILPTPHRKMVGLLSSAPASAHSVYDSEKFIAPDSSRIALLNLKEGETWIQGMKLVSCRNGAAEMR